MLIKAKNKILHYKRCKTIVFPQSSTCTDLLQKSPKSLPRSVFLKISNPLTCLGFFPFKLCQKKLLFWTKICPWQRFWDKWWKNMKWPKTMSPSMPRHHVSHTPLWLAIDSYYCVVQSVASQHWVLPPLLSASIFIWL